MKDNICPACMNSIPVSKLRDEVWCIRDTKNYFAILCEDHKECNLFIELQKAINNTKDAYQTLLKTPRCTCIYNSNMRVNTNSEMNCRIHGISAQLDRTQME